MSVFIELSERTDLSIYTTSIDGTRHSWTANGTFGFYANKQYLLPAEDHQPFVCCLNVTVQRHQDIAVRGIFKRFEFIYRIEAAGYRREQSTKKKRLKKSFKLTNLIWLRSNVPLCETSPLSKCEISLSSEPYNWKWSHCRASMCWRFQSTKYGSGWNPVWKRSMEGTIPNLWK